MFTFLNHKISNVHAAAFLLGAAGLLSRLLGVLRDRLLAGTFGASRELDIYYAAFQIPDFVAVMFLLGAGAAAILPVFQEYLSRDRALAHRLISRLFTGFFLVSLGVALVMFFIAPILARFIAPGFSGDEQGAVAALTRVMLLSPVLLGLSSILSSVVQSFQRFFAFALAPIFYNVGIIIGIIFFVPAFGIMGLGWGVIVGAALHFLITWISARGLGFAPYPVFQGESRGVRKIVRIAFPRVLSVSLSQITLLVLIAIGSTLAAGSIAVFNLAQNLYFLPVGVFGISYATALFPRISRAFISRDAKDFFYEFFIGIRSILFWIVPIAILFVVLRAHIVRVALGAGAFSWEDTRLTAAVLAVFTIVMLEASLTTFFMKGFYALENTWRPFWINIASSVVSIGAALFFIDLFAAHSPFARVMESIFRVSDLLHTEVLGLALGLALGRVLNILGLYFLLMRKAEDVFHERAFFPWAAVLKIFGAALVAGAVAYAVRASFSNALPLLTFVQVLVQGTSAGFAGFIAYFGALFLLGSDDAYSLLRGIRGRLFKLGVLPEHWDGDMNPTHRP